MNGPDYRVTIDLDGHIPRFEMVAIRTYHNLRREVDDVEVRVSSSGTGIHLVGHVDEPLTFAERVELRHALNDDGNRIKIDIERYVNGVYTGVLWDQKGDSQEPGKTRGTNHADRDFSTIWDALDHIDATTTDPSDRMAALADQGHKGAPDLVRKAEAYHA